MWKGSRGSVLLIELLIVIFFFSVSASIDLRLFGVAHERQVASRALTRALVACQDWAEMIYAADEPLSMLKSEGWKEQTGNIFSLSADGFEMFAALDSSPARAGTLLSGSVRAEKDGETLFEIPVSRYSPSGGEAN